MIIQEPNKALSKPWLVSEWTVMDYYQDELGSTSHVANSSGALLESYRYDMYGKPLFFNSTSQPLNSSAYGVRDLFTGQRYVSELGLYDDRNRFMSPDQGRFLQPDPIGFKGDASNLYRYVGNNWANKTDPMGLEQQGYLPNDYPRATQSATGVIDQWLLAEQNTVAGERAAGALQTEQRAATAEHRFQLEWHKRFDMRFNNAVAHMFGSRALLVPYQSMKNAPYLNMRMSVHDLYKLGRLLGARELKSQKASGMSLVPKELKGRGFFVADSLRDLRGTIFIANDTRGNPNQIYAHELANILSDRLTGDAKTFGDKSDQVSDHDTGAVVEQYMFGKGGN